MSIYTNEPIQYNYEQNYDIINTLTPVYIPIHYTNNQKSNTNDTIIPLYSNVVVNDTINDTINDTVNDTVIEEPNKNGKIWVGIVTFFVCLLLIAGGIAMYKK